MSKFFPGSPARQRGIVSVLFVMLMISALLFVLVQTLGISASSSSDDALQRDRVGALSLAESGLERAVAQIKASVVEGSFSYDSNCCIGTSGNCSAGLPATALPLGTGNTFAYLKAEAKPDGCNAFTCKQCVVTVRGESGGAERTISRAFTIKQAMRASCTAVPSRKDCSNQKATSWWLILPAKTTSYGGIAVVNSAVAGATCLNDTTGCLAPSGSESASRLAWHLANGSALVGIGETAQQTTNDTYIFQRLSANTDVAAAGALFPSSGTKTPNVVGSYWNAASTAGSVPTNSQTAAGLTNNGAAPQLTNATACIAPSPGATNPPPAQTCSNWCYRDGTSPEGDTLVFGFSAHSSNAKNNELQKMLFDTRSGTAPGIPMTRVEKAATATVYSELWYKHNPAYSYGTRILGTITAGSSQTATTYTVNYDPDNGGFCVVSDQITKYLKAGDTLLLTDGSSISSYGSGSSTITVREVSTNITGTRCTTGSLLVKANPVPGSKASNKQITFNITYNLKRVLTVTKFIGGPNIAVGDFVVGDQVTAGSQIVQILSGTGREGTYLLGEPSDNAFSERPMVIGGAKWSTVGGVTTVSVPNAPLPPTVTAKTDKTEGTLVAVRVGNQRFDPNTQIASIAADRKSFTISPALTTNESYGAELCGGTCAMFDHASPNTSFSTSPLPSGTDWVAGFTCLDGAGTPSSPPPEMLQSSWQDVTE